MKQGHVLEPQGHINDSPLNEMTLLSENELRETRKSAATLVSSIQPEDDASLLRLQQLLKNILRTANAANLSLAHSAAALGALHGLLDQCSLCANQSVRSLVLHETVWSDVLDIYLTKSENHKPKPLRSLLLMLAILIDRRGDQNIRQDLMSRAVSTCVEAICDQGDSVSVRPAIHFLEHFLARQLITASSIVASAPIQPSVPGLEELSEISIPKCHVNVRATTFIRQLLDWIQYPDCAPAVGRFLPLFVSSLETFFANDFSANEKSEKVPPLWIDPVKSLINDHPTLHETVENHVLPALLRLDANTTQTFLDTLRSSDMQDGSSGLYRESEIQLCLLTARVGSKMNPNADYLLSE